MEAVRQERLRVSRELHDGLAQQLASLGYVLDELADVDDPKEISAASMSAREQLDGIHATLRATIDRLRSDEVADDSAMGEVGVGPALAAFARESGRRYGFDVLVRSASPSSAGSLPRLPASVESELVWIGREAITNVARHAGACRLWLTVDIDPPAARVVIADDGTSGAVLHPRGGHGMAIMAERAERVGATVHIDDRPDAGTVVTVSLGEGAR